MTMLPPATDITGSSITEGQAKTWLTNVRTFLSELLGTSGADKKTARQTLGVIMNSHVGTVTTYNVTTADAGKVIQCYGNITVNVAACLTLGDGFAFGVLNGGTGTVTIDPNGTEQIDGATTKAIAAGKFAMIYCDGSKLVSVGALATGPGSGLDADTLDGSHAAAFQPAGSYAPDTAIVNAVQLDGADDNPQRIRFTRANGTTFDVVTFAGTTGGGGE